MLIFEDLNGNLEGYSVEIEHVTKFFNSSAVCWALTGKFNKGPIGFSGTWAISLRPLRALLISEL